MTNLISRKEKLFKGYVCYKLYRDRNGDFFKDGARYVAFLDNCLLVEADSQAAAEKAYREDKPTEDCRLEDYKGIPR